VGFRKVICSNAKGQLKKALDVDKRIDETSTLTDATILRGLSLMLA